MRKSIFLAKRALLCRRELLGRRELRLNELMSEGELADLNWHRRQQLVRYVFDNNIFYRKKYQAAGFEPGDLKEPSDFERLPILEKQEIRDHVSDLVSRGFDAGDLKCSTTGGSTGVPLKTFQDPSSPYNEISWRMLNWWGVDISDSSGYIYRAIPSGTHRLLQKMLLWPTRRNWIAASKMTDVHMERFFRRLRADRPSYLVGYVGAIDVFADFLERQDFRLDSLKAIWTTAAPLAAGKRRYLQGVFGAPVYTQYGSCEFYWISAECKRQDGMHIASDLRHIDVVDGIVPVPKGRHGDLLVTDLMNQAFPLIRYRLGDRGRLLDHACPCGLPFPLMDYVDGRTSDKLHLPDGSMIPGEALAGIFRGYPESIKSYQIRQSADYGVVVRYEPLFVGGHERVIEEIHRKLDEQLKHLVDVRFIKGAVDVNDNGKTRFLVSEIES